MGVRQRLAPGLATLLGCCAAAPVSGALPPVRVRGGRFVDQAGRTRHFRGVNVVYKDPPWLPHATAFHPNVSFVRDDVELLASYGVNLIRLGVMWPGVVPEARGKVDAAYLDRALDLVRMAAEHGIYAIVEPHQDELNPRFCGEGVPDWWADEFLQVADFPVPLAPSFKTSKPTHEQCWSQVSFDYLWTHDVARAFQAVYDCGAADFGAYWAAVASAFAGEPSVIGGELWNEPFPGDVYAGDGRLRNNSLADEVNLLPFYTQVTEAIRNAVPDRERFVLAYEPSWPVGTQDIRKGDLLSPTSGFSALPEEDAIYAFHYYSPPCSTDLGAELDARVADARRLKAAPLMSELNFGASDPPSEARMTEQLALLESRMVSYTGWQYKSFSGSLPNGTCTGCGNSFFGDDGALFVAMARAVARPFAGAVAGETLTSSFSASPWAFTLTYVCSGTGGAPTEIVVPGLSVPPGGGLHVQVVGDDGAKVSVELRPGRQIPNGPEILPANLVRIAHGDTAVGRRIRVVVSQAARTIYS